ncbi:MAG: hypothetical protein K0R93_358 [Anaerosolibacter sp.]|jgi:hypothetical protein|uniref:hypothetical protein n=1 Tax=Anaerosolibacter sp. TaxID=1872527 RepID=UPI00261898DB|nr:hypothetical protein [Anaerosolibacter sp.]MDF2545460.1 hypothetical protein [Anaerosolibacter sp.]
MDLNSYPSNVQKFLSEFIKRGTLDPNSIPDKTLINFLATQEYDADYIDELMHWK